MSAYFSEEAYSKRPRCWEAQCLLAKRAIIGALMRASKLV